MEKTLFDHISSSPQKEDGPLNRLKNLDEKIAEAVSKIKAFKEEKIILEQRIKELEAQLDEKNQEIERVASEKSVIKSQIEDLLNELENVELG